MFVILSIIEGITRYDRWGEHEFSCEANTSLYLAKDENEIIEILTNRLLQNHQETPYWNFILENFEDLKHLAEYGMDSSGNVGVESIRWADFYLDDPYKEIQLERIQQTVEKNINKTILDKKNKEIEEATKKKLEEEARQTKAAYEHYLRLKTHFEAYHPNI